MNRIDISLDPKATMNGHEELECCAHEGDLCEPQKRVSRNVRAGDKPRVRSQRRQGKQVKYTAAAEESVCTPSSFFANVYADGDYAAATRNFALNHAKAMLTLILAAKKVSKIRAMTSYSFTTLQSALKRLDQAHARLLRLEKSAEDFHGGMASSTKVSRRSVRRKPQ